MKPKVGDIFFYNGVNDILVFYRITKLTSNYFYFSCKHIRGSEWIRGSEYLSLDILTGNNSSYTILHPTLVKLWRLDD